jgi:hypothetical protein
VKKWSKCFFQRQIWRLFLQATSPCLALRRHVWRASRAPSLRTAGMSERALQTYGHSADLPCSDIPNMCWGRQRNGDLSRGRPPFASPFADPYGGPPEHRPCERRGCRSAHCKLMAIPLTSPAPISPICAGVASEIATSREGDLRSPRPSQTRMAGLPSTDPANDGDVGERTANLWPFR